MAFSPYEDQATNISLNPECIWKDLLLSMDIKHRAIGRLTGLTANLASRDIACIYLIHLDTQPAESIPNVVYLPPTSVLH